MNDILNSIFGSELYSVLPPELQALLCLFVFLIVAWVIVRIFRAIGEFR